MDNEKKGTLSVILTPFIIIILCAAIAVAVGYYPLRKVSNIAGVAFSASAEHKKMTAIQYDTKEVEAELEDGNQVVYPSFGQQYAEISIESIGLEAPVFWGSSADLLKQGVCQYIGSVFIGEKGNVVLDAHCNTFFYELGNVKPGDIVKLKTSYGEFTYKMKESVIFKETDNSYISPTNDDRLTLYTCYGNLLGPTEDRLGVICELVEKKFYSQS